MRQVTSSCILLALVYCASCVNHGQQSRSSRPAEAIVANSKQIAALLGPTMVAMLVAEFPLVQPHLYEEQIAPVGFIG